MLSFVMTPCDERSIRWWLGTDSRVVKSSQRRMSRVIDEMNRHGKISRAVRRIGFALFALAVLGGERIATSLGWKYPDWLRSLTGLIAIVIGILFIISALSVMRQAGRK